MFYSTVELADVYSLHGTPVNNTQGLRNAGQWSGNKATDVGMVRQDSYTL